MCEIKLRVFAWFEMDQRMKQKKTESWDLDGLTIISKKSIKEIGVSNLLPCIYDMFKFQLCILHILQCSFRASNDKSIHKIPLSQQHNFIFTNLNCIQFYSDLFFTIWPNCMLGLNFLTFYCIMPLPFKEKKN